MISFSREGTKVRIDIETYIPKYSFRMFSFYWECDRESYAGLLAQHFDSELVQVLKDIREESYVQGWKDAKAKVEKETWFSGGWE